MPKKNPEREARRQRREELRGFLPCRFQSLASPDKAKSKFIKELPNHPWGD